MDAAEDILAEEPPASSGDAKLLELREWLNSRLAHERLPHDDIHTAWWAGSTHALRAAISHADHLLARDAAPKETPT